MGFGSILEQPFEDVRNVITFDHELGRGEFGETRLCFHKLTGEKLACKTIPKWKLFTESDVEDVRREVQVMHHLVGHENIVELKGAYEDRNCVHLLMDLCEGGGLSDHISNCGHYSEKNAAALFRTIVKVVHFCHSMGVMHRDLQLENFLFVNKHEDAALKVIDFGVSVFFKPGDRFTEIVGNNYYVAPEMLKQEYGPECDIWSIGVILYLLLSGAPPFRAETQQGIFDSILEGHLDFTSAPWPSISKGAKDLLKQMLKQDPRERYTIEDIFSHPWVKEGGNAPDKPLDNVVLSRIKQFSAMSKFKKVALKVIAGRLSEEEIMGLTEMFKSMDTDNNGSITCDELKIGLSKLGTNLGKSDVTKLMQEVDVDGNGTLDYLEFITATFHLKKMETKDHLYSAFQHFDKDNSGFISLEELEQALLEHDFDNQKAAELLHEIDADNDGQINYDEFVAMMCNGHIKQ